MPELPEIAVLASDMNRELTGRVITGVQVLQPKCLNLPEDDFVGALVGTEVMDATAHGKWIQVALDDGWLLLNLGMGGEILYTDREHLPEKHRLVFDLDNGRALAINFWWFGSVHYVHNLDEHPQVSRLGPDFLSLTLAEFRELLQGRRGGIKSFLVNQKHIAGIGNVYVQDPLFSAGIHPLRTINTLNDDEMDMLWQALRETMEQSIALGGSHWEQNLHGEHGRWDSGYFHVAYREGEPCPDCGTIVEKIKTGSTSTHICPNCQPLEPIP